MSREVLASGSFNLRQWASNSNRLMDKATKLEVADSNPIVKVLGLYWDIGRDMYLFNSSLEWDKKLAVSIGGTSVLKFFKDFKFNSGFKILAYVLMAFNTERVREGGYIKHSSPIQVNLS